MGFGLFDLLFAIACLAIGGSFGGAVVAHFAAGLSQSALRTALMFGFATGGLGAYLILVAPFYRLFRLRPMVLPRCPCCKSFQSGYYIGEATWPRIGYRCPTCHGEFVIWHNGRTGDQETWDRPVLALKWPYAWGIYKNMPKPKTQADIDRE